MTPGAAATEPQGPRASWGAVAVLAGFLLMAPPIFFFGPLAGLLLLCGPRRFREWLWLLAAVLWTVLWAREPGGLALQVVRAAGVLVSGAWLVAVPFPSRSLVSRGLLAVALAGLALAGWAWHFGIGWAEIQQAVEQDLLSVWRQLATQAAADSAEGSVLDALVASSDTVASLYPASLALAGLAGTALAWSWHVRIASRPLGGPAPKFAEFRFSDQLVWGWVAGVGLRLAPLAEPGPTIGANLLLVWTTLYAVRGLAVMWPALRRLPGAVLAAVVLVSLFFFPFVAGGLTILGLLDTWLDFRRRSSPATGGFDR